MVLMQINLSKEQSKKLSLIKVNQDLHNKWEALFLCIDRYEI